jgi:hypothetical protein
VVNILILCFLIGSTYATIFSIQPIEQQIKESDGLFQGNFLRKKTVQLENGSLASQMVFKISKEVGLQSEFFGMDEVIVHYPGGTFEGKTVKVEGVPEFVSGEKVILFIRSIDNRYWGMNLGFGTYKVINYGKEVVLVNYLFPAHPQVGQVSMQYFENAIKEIKGSNLKVVQNLNSPVINKQTSLQRMPSSERQNRSVAATSNQLENQEERPGLTIFWLVVALGLLGGVFRMTRQKVFH